MLYYLQQLLIDNISFMRVFRYISIRTLLSFLISFFVVWILGKPFIKYLRSKKIGEGIRKLGPDTHAVKEGTPTMGGVLIVVSIIFTNLITGRLTNKFTIILMLATILFASIGFLDDYLKWSGKNKDGLSPVKKILGQVIIGIIIWGFMLKFPLLDGIMNFSLINPIMKNSYLFIGAFLYLLLIIFILSGTSNAVNITDGLDGLVIVPVMIVIFVLGVIAYLTGHAQWSSYLNLYYIEGVGEILIFVASILGSGLGFLWYNFYPAQIFMGDTGSLTLGGIIGMISIFLKQELLLPIIGAVFVIETFSVILQVGSYKMKKKRIFKMAPIHHHFELMGLAETKVTIRFWITSILFAVLGLIILKIR
ncbi:MAG: phospho-N-acetylmuramoyl-pentapeptide-transferase [Fusobacteriota bacterium]